MVDQVPRDPPAAKDQGVNLEPRVSLELMAFPEKRDLTDPPDHLVNPASQAQMEHPEYPEHPEHPAKEE